MNAAQLSFDPSFRTQCLMEWNRLFSEVIGQIESVPVTLSMEMTFEEFVGEMAIEVSPDLGKEEMENFPAIWLDV